MQLRIGLLKKILLSMAIMLAFCSTCSSVDRANCSGLIRLYRPF